MSLSTPALDLGPQRPVLELDKVGTQQPRLCLPAVEGAVECGAEAEACGVRLRSLASVGDRLLEII